MHAYFVRHPLEARAPMSPGRVAYDVRADSLSRNGTSYKKRPFCGTIFADGFGANRPGPNVDPNVFSDVIPWFHAFCQISSAGSGHHVRPHKAVLSEIVRSGDLIFYGHAISSHMLFIDTVLCVETVVPLPQSARSFQIREQMHVLLADLKLSLSSAAFCESRSYSLSLRDCEKDGHHPASSLGSHRMIVGRRSTHDGLIESVDSLLTRFQSGDGFNFIPLLENPPSKSKAVLRRRGLFVTKFRDAGTLCQRKVSELQDEQARSLLLSILSNSDELVLDPIDPQCPLERASYLGR